MQNMEEKIRQFQEKVKDVKNLDELFGKNGLLTDLMKDTVQTLLEAELTHHLGYPKNLKIFTPGTNKRNGTYPKKLRTGSG